MAATNLIGVDVGGTFTDLIVMDEATGAGADREGPDDRRATRPRACSPRSARRASRRAEIKVLVHGTTTATNALLERKGARGRADHDAGLPRRARARAAARGPTPYGLKGTFEPLIPRDLRLEVPERMDAEGQVVDAARRGRGAARGRGAEGGAASKRSSSTSSTRTSTTGTSGARARSRPRVWPNAYVTVGAELLPEYREFERGTTAAINGYVQPIIDRYLRTARRRSCGARAIAHELLIMQGNGGTMSVDVAARHAVNTLMSGPAAGVKAAAHTALAAGYRNVISLRHGRHQLRRRRDPRRRARRERGQGDGLRPAGARADDRHPHDRRRRRLHRARELGRHPAGRAGERRRRAGPDLLRPRRRRADHRPTRTCCSAA